MIFKKRVIADAGYFSSKWAPVVLRFFQLFVGNQAMAEALAIDTLTEHFRESGAAPDGDITVPLLRRALAKASANPVTFQSSDPLVRAVTQVEPTRRAVIVLFRGLSLELNTVAQIIGLDSDRIRGVAAAALEELHQRLSMPQGNGLHEPEDPSGTLREAE